MFISSATSRQLPICRKWWVIENSWWNPPSFCSCVPEILESMWQKSVTQFKCFPNTASNHSCKHAQICIPVLLGGDYRRRLEGCQNFDYWCCLENFFFRVAMLSGHCVLDRSFFNHRLAGFMYGLLAVLGWWVGYGCTEVGIQLLLQSRRVRAALYTW